MPHQLTPAIAQRFAEAALGHVTREYPHKLDHVMDGPEDVLGPRDLHPIFFGSFDWHSCVHGYWLLMRVRRLFPDIPAAPRIDVLLEEMITPENVAGELAYLDRPYSGGFERPYGWAWAMALHREAQRGGYGEVLEPLARAFAERLALYLPKLTYPIRVGTHYNTAFALILALEWADENHGDLAALIRTRAADYYGADRDCPGWEPGGTSSCRRLGGGVADAPRAGRSRFAAWLAGFLPRIGEGNRRACSRPPSCRTAATARSRTSTGSTWPAPGAGAASPTGWSRRSRRAHGAAEAHLDASLPHVTGDYMGEHWLATFACWRWSSRAESVPGHGLRRGTSTGDEHLSTWFTKRKRRLPGIGGNPRLAPNLLFFGHGENRSTVHHQDQARSLRRHLRLGGRRHRAGAALSGTLSGGQRLAAVRRLPDRGVHGGARLMEFTRKDNQERRRRTDYVALPGATGREPPERPPDPSVDRPSSRRTFQHGRQDGAGQIDPRPGFG
jgi:hypothetical protein